MLKLQGQHTYIPAIYHETVRRSPTDRVRK